MAVKWYYLKLFPGVDGLILMSDTVNDKCLREGGQ